MQSKRYSILSFTRYRQILRILLLFQKRLQEEWRIYAAHIAPSSFLELVKVRKAAYDQYEQPLITDLEVALMLENPVQSKSFLDDSQQLSMDGDPRIYDELRQQLSHSIDQVYPFPPCPPLLQYALTALALNPLLADTKFMQVNLTAEEHHALDMLTDEETPEELQQFFNGWAGCSAATLSERLEKALQATHSLKEYYALPALIEPHIDVEEFPYANETGEDQTHTSGIITHSVAWCQEQLLNRLQTPSTPSFTLIFNALS
jgi:hypothetical protein